MTEQVQEGVAAAAEGSQAATQAKVAEQSIEELVALREQLEKAQAQAAEYLDG